MGGAGGVLASPPPRLPLPGAAVLADQPRLSARTGLGCFVPQGRRLFAESTCTPQPCSPMGLFEDPAIFPHMSCFFGTEAKEQEVTSVYSSGRRTHQLAVSAVGRWGLIAPMIKDPRLLLLMGEHMHLEGVLRPRHQPDPAHLATSGPRQLPVQSEHPGGPVTPSRVTPLFHRPHVGVGLCSLPQGGTPT